MVSSADSCPVCGFVWDEVAIDDAPARVAAATAALVRVLEVAGERGLTRPTPERWSIVEYAGHLRDVLLSQRERIIVASVTDTPTGVPIYRDDRIALGFSSLDTPTDVSRELEIATSLLLKTLVTLPRGYETRPLIYSPLLPGETTIAWVAAQAVHESEHHLSDVEEHLRTLTS